MNVAISQSRESSLAGRRIAIVGRLASMSRRDADLLIRERGGQTVERVDAAHCIVIGDEVADLRRAVASSDSIDDSTRAAIARGDVETVRESEFWSRLGFLDADLSVAHLYTPAMLAELVRAPIASIRQWHRDGALVAKREMRRLPYFDFEEVCVAQKLAALSQAGCSLSVIRRKLKDLAKLLPSVPRPLADPEVIVEGRRVFIRRGDGLAEPSGQLLIDFSGQPASSDLEQQTDDCGNVALPFAVAEGLSHSASRRPRGSQAYAADDLRALAAEVEANGRSQQAIEIYRAVIVSGEYTAEDHFALAELLYRAGDLSAARERYYVAIELDEDYVEARSNLGCVLAELGEMELAEAAFRGALECHPKYADAHYHLARLLDRLGHAEEAAAHWQQFAELAPASPWSDEARERMAGTISE